MKVNLYRIDPEIRPAYLRILKTIRALKAMPLEYRDSKSWQEQFARFQHLRDSLVPPQQPPRNRKMVSKRQRSAAFRDPNWINRRMKMFGDKPLSSGDSHRFLINWK